MQTIALLFLLIGLAIWFRMTHTKRKAQAKPAAQAKRYEEVGGVFRAQWADKIAQTKQNDPEFARAVERVDQITDNPDFRAFARNRLLQLAAGSSPDKADRFLTLFAEQVARETETAEVAPEDGWSLSEARRLVPAASSEVRMIPDMYFPSNVEDGTVWELAVGAGGFVRGGPKVVTEIGFSSPHTINFSFPQKQVPDFADRANAFVKRVTGTDMPEVGKRFLHEIIEREPGGFADMSTPELGWGRHDKGVEGTTPSGHTVRLSASRGYVAAREPEIGNLQVHILTPGRA